MSIGPFRKMLRDSFESSLFAFASMFLALYMLFAAPERTCQIGNETSVECLTWDTTTVFFAVFLWICGILITISVAVGVNEYVQNEFSIANVVFIYQGIRWFSFIPCLFIQGDLAFEIGITIDIILISLALLIPCCLFLLERLRQRLLKEINAFNKELSGTDEFIYHHVLNQKALGWIFHILVVVGLNLISVYFAEHRGVFDLDFGDGQSPRFAFYMDSLMGCCLYVATVLPLMFSNFPPYRVHFMMFFYQTFRCVYLVGTCTTCPPIGMGFTIMFNIYVMLSGMVALVVLALLAAFIALLCYCIDRIYGVAINVKEYLQTRK